MDLNSMDHLEGRPKSPNLLVMETWVKPLREKFYQRHYITAYTSVQRFYKIWAEMKAKKINKTIDSYPARLHEVIRQEGATTKYEELIQLILLKNSTIIH